VDGLRVSVIISNFNYADYLETAINSVLNQTYPHCQLIVVDDGSTDGSEAILQKYRGRALIVRKQHEGETSGRNAGYVHATGDIIAFLDADDFWINETIERVVEVWTPDLAKLQFPLRVVDRHGEPTGGRMPRLDLTSGWVDSLLLTTGRYITCPTSGNFYPRRLLDAIFPVPADEWPQSVDSYAATYAGFTGRIGVLKDELGSYRIHNSNMTLISGAKGISREQIERLMERGQRLRRLIQRIASERQLLCSSGVVTAHWMYLKLAVAHAALTPGVSRYQLLRLTRKLLRSVCHAPELTRRHAIQWLLWSLGVLLLPEAIRYHLIRISFDLTSGNPVARALRQH
jgi:glycosyltransferase involved in cell wall biosynthesis